MAFFTGRVTLVLNASPPDGGRLSALTAAWNSLNVRSPGSAGAAAPSPIGAIAQPVSAKRAAPASLRNRTRPTGIERRGDRNFQGARARAGANLHRVPPGRAA
jgi:hypothetical protein